MQVALSYRSRSRVLDRGGNRLVAMQPNLAREEVALVASLRQPLRFREAISALHDVVVSDLRYKKRDKSAYEAFRAERERQERAIHRDGVEAYDRADGGQTRELVREQRQAFKRAVSDYWRHRDRFRDDVRKNDPDLWRAIMPLDPVVTVADDVVTFECFSADESSYGCLTLDRNGLDAQSDVALGTTNVDYSWALYDHFQTLRSYRDTRLHIAPEGFGAVTETGGGEAAHFEQKIDLPESWLQGFLQVQAATAMPLKRVSLSRDCVYSLLAFMKRNRPRTSPRALRLELQTGQPARLVLEPWERAFDSRSGPYLGPPCEPIRLWGTRRLMFLHRILPLAERFDVYLLGTGLPSFWVAHLGEMRLTIGNSGWTDNDWTGGSAIDAMRPPVEVTAAQLDAAAAVLREQRRLRRDALPAALGCEPAAALARVDALAHRGQVIYDLHDEVYRYRSILPPELAQTQIGRPNPQRVQAEQYLANNVIRDRRVEDLGDGRVAITGKIAWITPRVVVDADGVIVDGACECDHHRRAGLRRGPCGHLIALRDAGERPTADAWYRRMTQWASAN